MIQINGHNILLLHVLNGLVSIGGHGILLRVFVENLDGALARELVLEFYCVLFVEMALFYFRDRVLVFFVGIYSKKVVNFTFIVQKTLLHTSICI
jgi:hypothetical protein